MKIRNLRRGKNHVGEIARIALGINLGRFEVILVLATLSQSPLIQKRYVLDPTWLCDHLSYGLQMNTFDSYLLKFSLNRVTNTTNFFIIPHFFFE